uniref:Acetylglutamate kinase n=1 Tax=Roseihalotalea indica TaxID=2867963 RepID=A0AA49JGC9_9BACT|nr:acetylglutamate kinase [Tunicatimonas sp. TK19036]
MSQLSVIKIGGKVIDQPDALQKFLTGFSRIPSPKILVHGGGTSASQFAEKVGVPVQMVEGRRITDAAMLKVVVMIYAGWVNKQIVSGLQARSNQALGVTGADLNLIKSRKRPPQPIDFGYVGDVTQVNSAALKGLLEQGVVPVLAPITHDGKGNLLNTNADTIAAEVAMAMASDYDVHVGFCFEKKGVLLDVEDENSVLNTLSYRKFQELRAIEKINAGMIPKLDNAFRILESGVGSVRVMHFGDINHWTETFSSNQYFLGTKLQTT